MSEADRRRSPRYTVGLPVQVQAGADACEGQLTSISRLGALVQAEKAFPVGETLHLVVNLPEGVLEVHGHVVRTDTSGGVHSHGILFAPLAEAALSKLDSLLPR
ncbi:MAG: PilZ domain-containing protein [Vicinamibacteria bacterium]